MKKIILSFILIISNTYGQDLSYLEKDLLTATDVDYLKSRYLKYSSAYSRLNELELQKKVPLVSTNPHHHSVQYWLKKEFISKNIKGLPILHFDSHTDMGFSPSHYKHQGRYLKTHKLLDSPTVGKIESFQNALKDISQVIVPAMATKLSNEIHMCMPSWFDRVNIYDKYIPMGLKTLNKNTFIGASTHRTFPITNIINQFPETPFIHEKTKNLNAKMFFYRCLENVDITLDSDYILSLDLDFFSSNGEHQNHSRPISLFRSSGNQITKREFKEFKKRLKTVKKIIEKLSDRNINPRIITIADSTLEKGGGYTPVALAYLANLFFTRILRK